MCLTKNSNLSLNTLVLVDPYSLGLDHIYRVEDREVVIDNESSDFLPVTSGVPQGSILGPLLFLLFVNDTPNAISKETTLPLFADDSKCFRLILAWAG